MGFPFTLSGPKGEERLMAAMTAVGDEYWNHHRGSETQHQEEEWPDNSDNETGYGEDEQDSDEADSPTLLTAGKEGEAPESKGDEVGEWQPEKEVLEWFPEEARSEGDGAAKDDRGTKEPTGLEGARVTLTRPDAPVQPVP